MKKKMIGITMCMVISAVVCAETIKSNQYAIWGIDDDEISIPSGSVITEAVLTIVNVSPQDAQLNVCLLDNTIQGFQKETTEVEGNIFEFCGVPLTGIYEDGNLIFRFSQTNDSQSRVWNVFSNPCNIQLGDGSAVQLSSSLLELIDFMGNGGGFGIGISSADLESVNITGLKMEVTIQSYQLAASSIISFFCNLDSLISSTAHWTMDDSANSTVVLDSGSAGLTGTASRRTDSMAGAGVMNGALEFNGTSDYVQIAPNSAIDQYGRSSFAISAWIYPHSTGEGGDGRILSKRSTGYDFYLTGTNAIGVYIPHTTKAAWRVSLSNAITLNTWQHVAFVYNEDGDQAVKLYVNGILQNGGQNTAGQGTLSDDRQKSLIIGRLSSSNIRQFDGLMDDIQIFGQALTSSQIEEINN